MAFTPFSTNVKNLESLGTDKPNADLGLTGLQLRQRFDKAVSDIKAWINDTFLTEIAGIGGAQNIGITQISGMDSTNVQAALAELYNNRGQVQDGSITLSKLSNSFSLPTGKLADGAVTSVKIAANAVTTDYSATLSFASWAGNTPPYTLAKTVNGVKSTDVPIIDLIPSSVYSTAVNEINDWSYIYKAVTSENTITFYATDKPTNDLTVKARCVRK